MPSGKDKIALIEKQDKNSNTKNKAKENGKVETVEMSATPPSTLEPAVPNVNTTRRLSNAQLNWQHIRATHANGSAKHKGDGHLNIPGADGASSQEEELGAAGRRRSSVVGERRASRAFSVESRMSTVDLSKYNAEAAVVDDDEDEGTAGVTASDTSTRSAIPYLPIGLAVIFMLLNTFIPGLGTMLSGLSIFCCGRPQRSHKEGKVSLCCTNLFVGVAQLFTVSFMLVGWFWSFVWGIYMIILAVEWRKEEKIRHEKKLQAMALTALSSQVRPWTLRT